MDCYIVSIISGQVCFNDLYVFICFTLGIGPPFTQLSLSGQYCLYCLNYSSLKNIGDKNYTSF